MMLTAALDDGGSLAVTHVSTHCSLREAIERVRPQRVLDVIELTDAHAAPVPRRAAHRRVRAQPARRRARPVRRRGHRADRPGDRAGARPRASTPAARTRPTPCSTRPCTASRYDAIVCMYHDQGHGPMKLLAFDTGVNVTLGLPIIRTSVDHGTAFDIAWQGVAFTDSLRHALDYAWKLASRSSTTCVGSCASDP